MGVLPLEFRDGESAAGLGLTGRETFDITGIASGLVPRGEVRVRATAPDGAAREFTARVRIDTPDELSLLPARRHPAVRAAAAHGQRAGVDKRLPPGLRDRCPCLRCPASVPFRGRGSGPAPDPTEQS